jgi:phenylacetic acid degradation operon negative regulatory protein
LLPPAWIGTAAYQLCRTLYGAVLEAAETHLTQVARRLDGPLPAAGAALHERFGGC